MSDISGDALIAQTLAAAGAGPQKKSGKLAVIAPVAILTVVAIAGGAAVGWLVGSSSMEKAEAALAPQKAAVEKEAAAAEKPESPNQVIKLQSIITNVASPPQTAVRLQASVVVKKAGVENAEVLAGQIEGDTLAFLRTIDLAQIEGARGLLHLREDLVERAKLRSPAVDDYLIESLIAQ